MAIPLKEFSPKNLSSDQIEAFKRFRTTDEYQLLKSKADEFRKNGDKTAGVFIVRDPILRSSIDVMLHWDLRFHRMRDGRKRLYRDQSSFWISKGVGFVLDGYSSSGWYYTSAIRRLKLDNHYAYPSERGLRRKLNNEEKLNFGLRVAGYDRDYRYGKGLVSALGWRYFGKDVITAP